MKYEVHMAAEAAKYELTMRLMRQEREYAGQAVKCEERGDYKTALTYAIDMRAVQKKREAIESADVVRVVTSNDDAFEVFLDRVKEFVAARVNEIYKQLFLLALRPWEADKALLDTALLDVELVASDLQQFAERYPASIHEYLDYLRAIPRDVECFLKEIGT
jgi:hypothetical protein